MSARLQNQLAPPTSKASKPGPQVEHLRETVMQTLETKGVLNKVRVSESFIV